LKPGLFTAQGRDAAGTVWFDDLGCGATAEPPTARLAGAPEARPRTHASHKGSYGDVAVIGGAPGMAGAALLAGSAALHAGAGRVFVGLLDPSAAPVDMAQPELMLRDAACALDLSGMTVVCGCGGGTDVSLGAAARAGDGGSAGARCRCAQRHRRRQRIADATGIASPARGRP
jgi:hypothetical protein